MSAVDQHAEAHRLKAQSGYGARRIAERLGISRYAAKRLLDEPLPVPVAEVAEPVAEEARPLAEVADAAGEPVAELADEERPVADEVAEAVGQERPAARVAEPVAVRVADEVRSVAGVAALVFRPVAGVPSAPAVPWLQIDLGRRPWLLREVRRLAWWGLRLPTVVDLAVRSFAAAYHHAITTGRLQPGQPYEVQTHIRPLPHRAAV